MEQLDLFHGEQVALVPLVVTLSWRGDFVEAVWTGWDDDGPNGRQVFASWREALASLGGRDDVRWVIRVADRSSSNEDARDV